MFPNNGYFDLIRRRTPYSLMAGNPMTQLQNETFSQSFRFPGTSKTSPMRPMVNPRKRSLGKAAPEVTAYYCKVCNVGCNSQTGLDDHLMGKKHKMCLAQGKQLPASTSTKKLQSRSTPLSTTPKRKRPARAQRSHFCALCARVFTSDEIYFGHLGEEDHMDRLIRRNINLLKESKDPSVYCVECDMFLDPPQMASHRQNTGHFEVLLEPLSSGFVVGKGASAGDTSKEEKSETPSKKVKREVDPDLTCQICHMTFATYMKALQHCRSKSHLESVARQNAKEPQNTATSSADQSEQGGDTAAAAATEGDGSPDQSEHDDDSDDEAVEAPSEDVAVELAEPGITDQTPEPSTTD